MLELILSVSAQTETATEDQRQIEIQIKQPVCGTLKWAGDDLVKFAKQIILSLYNMPDPFGKTAAGIWCKRFLIGKADAGPIGL